MGLGSQTTLSIDRSPFERSILNFLVWGLLTSLNKCCILEPAKQGRIKTSFPSYLERSAFPEPNLVTAMVASATYKRQAHLEDKVGAVNPQLRLPCGDSSSTANPGELGYGFMKRAWQAFLAP